MAGPVETPAYAARLHGIIQSHDLAERVELKLSFLPRFDLIELINNGRACASIPIDEDSMSYVAMEAFAARKSVITATDSGGLLEIVKNNETGFVVPPDPVQIAAAFDRVAHETRARELGGAARSLWNRLDITWASRIEQLLS